MARTCRHVFSILLLAMCSLLVASLAQADSAPDDGPTGDRAAAAWGGPIAALLSVEVQQATSCTACTSSQGSCSMEAHCNTYCQNLVGENGFCMTGCNCCVCPDALPDPDGGGGGTICQPVCRCDGASGPQGLCDPGCRQVNCI